MTACSSSPTGLNFGTPVHPSPAQVFLGSGVAFVLALCFFSIVGLRMESLLRSYPLLSIPFVVSMILAPSVLFISVRRMIEIGLQSRLVLSALLSVTAIGLTALTFVISLQHVAGR